MISKQAPQGSIQCTPFGLTILKPKGVLGSHIQALWALRVNDADNNQLSRWLPGDACSGLLFNLGAAIYLDGQRFQREVIYLPVSKKSHLIELSQSTCIVGVRFQQGISALLFGPPPQCASSLRHHLRSNALDVLLAKLLKSPNHYYQLRQLYQWALSEIDLSVSLPQSFSEALNILQSTQSIRELTEQACVSQRQIERHFRKWLDMTPNQHLRLMRVNSAMQFIKRDPQANLAALALNSGFSDQAHMTREFKDIAATTPLKFAKLMEREALGVK